MKREDKYRFLFAGGGTGGHLFPAIAVAEAIKAIKPQADIRFIGAGDKIEAVVVPELGYKFYKIWIQAFARKVNLGQLIFPLKLIVSLIHTFYINLRFKPKVAIGSGGYVAGPSIYTASLTGAKVILLEQNSYPGVTTRLLQNYADEIHISFNDTRRYLKRKENIFLTGNPIRSSLRGIEKSQAVKEFSLSPDKKVLLVLGGSLGAGVMNEAVAASIKEFADLDIQVIWQTGKNYYKKFNSYSSINIFVTEFINDMNAAYSACDLLISRAGATTIAELLVLGIPSVLVPSPNVTENHQFYNAKYLADEGAAVMIEDKDLKTNLIKVVNNLIFDENKLTELKKRCLTMSKPEAAVIIARNAINYAEKS